MHSGKPTGNPFSYGPAKFNQSRTPPTGPRHPHEMPIPGTGARRSPRSSPARSPRAPSSSLWAPSGPGGAKRQRLAPNEETPPQPPKGTTRENQDVASRAHSSALYLGHSLPVPPGQFSVKCAIPPEALGASQTSTDYRRSWFLDKRREIEDDGSRITTCRWFDDHVVVFAKPPASQIRNEGQVETPVSRNPLAAPPQRPHVYTFTSGTMTITKPPVTQQRMDGQSVQISSAPTSARQIDPPARKFILRRGGIPPPTAPTNRVVSSSALLIPPAPAPAPFSRPSSSTPTSVPRPSPASRPNSTPHILTTSPAHRNVNPPNSESAARSALAIHSKSSRSPPPAVAVLSSPVGVHSSSPRYSPRSVGSRSLSPFAQARSDSRPLATPRHDSHRPPRRTIHTPSAPLQPPPGEVILISSDDDRRSSSSSSSDEEDELASPRNAAIPTRRNSFSPRFTPSPPPSPEPTLDSLPTDEFEMAVEGTVSLPNDNKRDKPRRVLVDRPSGSVFTLMHHGFVDRYGRASRRRTNVYIPPVPAKEYAEDACSIDLRDGLHMIVAHSHLSGGKELTLISRSGNVHHFKRRLRPGDKAGASAVCALPNPRRFVAAGSDHSIYQWTITASAPPSSARLDSDSEDEFKAGFSAHERVLPYKHTSAVYALLPISNTLLASGGADCAVRIFDMGAQTLAHTLSPSNAVFNLHSLATTHPHSILLEVSHKELQFEVRDTRLEKTSRVTRFGWDAGRTSGKYVRGAVRGEVFACGDRDGVVRVWDLRNTRRPIETKSVFRGAKVVQVVFDGGKMYAVSEGNELAFINTV
ncbi:hypothetical protein PENSPDRAFT_686650 [Peniophora sp. CONT]|nr:hypothetical protein PENSPDRAFT_686650 [Peniophora sp. CONT]